MNMRRLEPVASEEKESVRADTQNGRHGSEAAAHISLAVAVSAYTATALDTQPSCYNIQRRYTDRSPPGRDQDQISATSASQFEAHSMIQRITVLTAAATLLAFASVPLCAQGRR